MFLLIDLKIGTGNEVGVITRMLGVDNLTEIGWVVRGVLCGVVDGGMNIDQFAHLLTDGIVIVDETFPVMLREERTQVVLIVLKEW